MLGAYHCDFTSEGRYSVLGGYSTFQIFVIPLHQFTVVLPPPAILSTEFCATMPWFHSRGLITRLQNYLASYELLNRYEATLLLCKIIPWSKHSGKHSFTLSYIQLMLLGFSWQTWVLLAQFSVLPGAAATLFEHTYTFPTKKSNLHLENVFPLLDTS